MQVNDTVRAVHTAGTIRRAFFATVLSVQPALPEDVGTNGEPTLTLGFLDPAQLHLIGGIEFHKAFRRQTTVRHVSHDEVQMCATEYCWTDVLPNDGGIIMLPNLNMSDLDVPAAGAMVPEDTIGTIVYINHKNGLEVFHKEEDEFVTLLKGEEHKFSDLFSAKAYVDAQPAAGMTDEEAAADAKPGFFIPMDDLVALSHRIIDSGADLEISPDSVVPSACILIDRLVGKRIEGSPRNLLGHQLFGENSEEVARGRYMIHLKEQADVAAAAQQEAAATSVTVVATATEPSAADLDAVAAEDQAKQDTSGAAPVVE